MNSISHNKLSNFEVMRSKLHEITFNYTKEMEETFEFLRDSKDYLEFKKIKKDIDDTRTFLAKVMNYEGMSVEQFSLEFHKFHELRKKIIREKYHICYLKHVFRILRLLQNDRNDIVHLGKKAKPEFENIEYCFRIIV